MTRSRRAGAPRPLTEAELELIEALLGAAGMGAGRYLGQLARVQVVGGCGCGCPSIDLMVGEVAPSGRPVPVIVADAESPEGVQVGVILWSCSRALSGLEVHPWNGSESVRLPHVESLMNFRK
jgi:hypothetical protein